MTAAIAQMVAILRDPPPCGTRTSVSTRAERDHRRMVIARELRLMGEATAAQIAERTGMSHGFASATLAAMCEDGLVLRRYGKSKTASTWRLA